jgi:hypothetical protein
VTWTCPDCGSDNTLVHISSDVCTDPRTNQNYRYCWECRRMEDYLHEDKAFTTPIRVSPGKGPYRPAPSPVEPSHLERQNGMTVQGADVTR